MNSEGKTFYNVYLKKLSGLKIKVCGMKQNDNIQKVSALSPDFMGFIFHESSPRNIDKQDLLDLRMTDIKIVKIGVFVNKNIEFILDKVKNVGLQGVQLHGSESEELCYTLRSAGLVVLKAFPIAETSDFAITEKYEGTCDYFLFDTKTPQHGGSGQKFDWDILSAYDGNTKFFLSGGISVEDLDSIRKIYHPLLAGVDLNSKFEIEPGVKDVELLNTFITQLRKS
jgi:phosphoribosylanthranilate isomerase